jgi:two-component system response regulator FlrC
MPESAFAITIDQLPNEIANWLVGHTVAEVERELIIHTLAHHCGCRTHTARTIKISIRTLRNKISEYEAIGIAVPAPGNHSLPRAH